MEPITQSTNKNLSQVYQNQISQLYERSTVMRHFRQAIQCRYYMTEDEIAIMQKYFRQPIVLDPDARATASHPIAKNMHDIAYERLYRIASSASSVIEIGPQLRRFLNFDHPRKHACAFINNIRDCQRYTNEIMLTPHRERTAAQTYFGPH
jgi:hypothetical protein